MGKWRYQPVVLDGDDPLVVLVEAHFDDAGELTSWTSADGGSAAEQPCWPCGDNADELRRNICRMLADAVCWQPARYADLRPGYMFARAITEDRREMLAQMFDLLRAPTVNDSLNTIHDEAIDLDEPEGR